MADVGSPVEGLGRGTPMVHRLVARHALSIDVAPILKEQGRLRRAIFHFEGTWWSPNCERRAACASSPGRETQQKTPHCCPWQALRIDLRTTPSRLYCQRPQAGL